jgi:hypothetical protein
MKRLEFTRPGRNAVFHPRTSGEAVTHLAQMTRERQRLQQERKTLMRRVRRLDARLKVIAATEARLVPMIQIQRAEAAREGNAGTPRRSVSLPAGVRELTLQY